MKNLKKRWGYFFSIIADPWTLVLIASVALLFKFSPDQTNTTIRSLFFVLITIASVILGGRVTKHWVDITEGGIVIARGKSAVRSLKLLLRNITALEKRVAKFENNTDEIKNHPKVTKRNYEEILETCNLLEEETVNSIENWTDIIPEADIKTQIGVISKLKQSLEGTKKELIESKNELIKLNNELDDTKGRSEEDHKKLKAKAKKKEKQIMSLKKEIMERKTVLGSSIEALGVTPGSVTFSQRRIYPHIFDVNNIENEIDETLSKHIVDYDGNDVLKKTD